MVHKNLRYFTAFPGRVAERWRQRREKQCPPDFLILQTIAVSRLGLYSSYELLVSLATLKGWRALHSLLCRYTPRDCVFTLARFTIETTEMVVLESQGLLFLHFLYQAISFETINSGQ